MTITITPARDPKQKVSQFMMEAQGYAASAFATSGRMVFRCDLKNAFDERQVQRLERRKPMEPRRAWWLHGIVCSFGVRRAFGVIILTFQTPMCIWTCYNNVSMSDVHLGLL